MKNRKGFTLTEVLLAVMVVGLIGVALASLTTAASREAGVGRSKVMLRNNLSLFLRTLRNDINAATYINMGAGTDPSTGGLLFELCDNKSVSGATITKPGGGNGCVTYTFEKGSKASGVKPAGATRGGRIKRNGSTVLNNVKYMPRYEGYASPSFRRVGNSGVASAIDMTLIVELDSTQTVNDIVEETFLLPNGL